MSSGFEIPLVRSSEMSKNDSQTSGIPAELVWQMTAYFWFSHKLHWLYIFQTSEWYIQTSDFYYPLARWTSAFNLKFQSLIFILFMVLKYREGRNRNFLVEVKWDFWSYGEMFVQKEQPMMMLWHGNTCCITGPLWGESTGHRSQCLKDFREVVLWSNCYKKVTGHHDFSPSKNVMIT